VTIPAGRTFTLVIDPDTALEEIVDATAVSTNTFTITRGIDGSTGQNHSAGAVVRHMAIGRDYRDANLHTQASASYNDGSGNAQSLHGIASGEGDVVGTDKAQTLTNKTLTAPVISDPVFTGTPLAPSSIVFEGSTVDDFETTLTVVDPTQDAIEAVDSTANKTMDAIGNAADSLGSAVANLFTFKLPSGFELVGAAKDGIESKLVTSIQAADSPMANKADPAAWFNFDRLLFDTGKATLQPSSREQLVNIAEILKAFPKVKLKVGGYTDNVGDPKANLKLSTDRAFNVVAELEKLGVEKGRLAPEGYGDKFPVGDNTTEEGRQQNRRIAVRITEK
jgi:outer membrane protein OmpA-like peptidoglycan-associated protein